jgi:exosortase/archaeosortase
VGSFGKYRDSQTKHIESGYVERQFWACVQVIRAARISDPISYPVYEAKVESCHYCLLGGFFLAAVFEYLLSCHYTISKDLGINASLIALTITVYMVVQGIAPTLLGAFSETYGHRLTFTITLTIYTAANLALAFTSNYPMLMILRGFQAGRSAATISISAGVIADIACPRERGRFIGTNAGIRYVRSRFSEESSAINIPIA